MKVHEYQAKELFRKYGVTVPRGAPVFTAAEALDMTDKMGYPCVVKAQIQAGGRGKGGGVRVVKDRSAAQEAIAAILGKKLVTAQTGSEGKIVNRLLIEQAIDIEQEYYASIILDRQKEAPVLIVSTEGGVEIEQVAAEQPDKIMKEWAVPGFGFQAYQLRKLAFQLTDDARLVKQFARIFGALYAVFEGCDASLVEINPLVVTRDKQVMALDAKLNLEDNGLYRHPDIAELRDESEEDPAEAEAASFNLNYIRLDGTVGCMVNGAGLAMATMDIIKFYGAEPANFLDVGGVASSHTIANGFRVLTSEPNVKAVLINIFGGIVRCDRVAEGILQALESVEIKVPVVVRLEGTNADKASKILAASKLNFCVAKSLKEAARLAIAATNDRGE